VMVCCLVVMNFLTLVLLSADLIKWHQLKELHEGISSGSPK